MKEEEAVFSPTERQKIAEVVLRAITLATTRTKGDAFFQTLVQEIAQALDVAYVSAGQVVQQDEMQIQTLAFVAHGVLQPNVIYALNHTPCQNVYDHHMCFHSCNVQQSYPLDTTLVDMHVESYIGVPMISSQGETLGVLVALDTKVMSEDTRLLALSLLSIFSARCASEIEHRQQTQALEAIIEQRSKALLEAQSHIMEQERLASLGGLVAGVAHEINTPIGVALTAASTLENDAKRLQACLEGPKVLRSELVELSDGLRDAANLVVSNLMRAGDLISSFKQLAVEQSIDEVFSFDLGQLIQAIMVALRPELKKHHVEVDVNVAEQIIVKLSAGSVSQILTNLVMNSLIHAFPKQQNGKITVCAERQGASIILRCADNGIGVSEEIKQKMFEPFFTTRRGRGGTGLGLNLVHNIVSKYGGSIQVDSAPNAGVSFTITLPDTMPDSMPLGAS